jgi:hypothetical protein
LAQAKEDLGDTEAQLGADTKFLADLEKRCNASDKVGYTKEEVVAYQMKK